MRYPKDSSCRRDSDRGGVRCRLAREDVMDLGLLLLRLVAGLSFAAHGTQKLFGWFGGHGLAGTGGFLEQLGFHPGKRAALMAGLGEAGGGLLLALGALTPLAAAILIGVML